jgi:ligand-binding sensor domain-containing protein/anti-sigma regulatory factor (Ser/Thr protein kinase)
MNQLLPQMTKLRFLVAILSILLSLPTIQAQGQKAEDKPDLRFQRIFEGLLNNRVSTVFQDHAGFIWVGTYSGLHRYDGLKFHAYTTNALANSIKDNYIGSIYEDSRGQLWIGTGGGVARYNRETDDFTRFSLPSSVVQHGGENNLVNTILEDKKGTLWLSSVGSGLYSFDRAENKFVPYKIGEITAINSLVADKDDMLWIATAGHGLVKLNTATSQTEYYRHDPSDPQSISSNNLKTLALDQQGNLWAGSRSEGLNRMVKGNDGIQFIRYLHDIENPLSLYNNSIYRLYVDPQGNLWTCNENGGLHLYDQEKDGFYRYLHDPKKTNSLSHNSVWNIFQDAQGRYWIGTAQSGLNLADPYASKFSHYFKNPLNPESLNNDIIRDFLETKDGNLWIATDGGGLNYFDRTKGTFKAYKNDPKKSKSLRSDAVISLNQDKEGRLWVGTWAGGLNILLNQQDGTFVRFQDWIKNDTYPIKHVFDVHHDENYIWIAALEEGLYRFDKRTKELRLFQTCEGNADCISSNLPIRIFEDSRKNLWIGTHSGLNMIRSADKESGKFKVYQPSESDPNSIPGNSIRQILEDRHQNIWVATNKGLAKYSHDTDNFITFGQKDGLPIDEVTSVVEDDRGFLWIGTIQGLAKFDPATGSFTHFDKHDGLQGNEFSRYSVLKTSQGELLFGGMNGFNLFHPEHLQINPFGPEVYLADLKLFNQSVNFRLEDSPLQKHISSTDTLTLSYKENVLTFDFMALNYTHPDQSQFAYYLEGFEEDWNYVGPQRNATYTNLNPGTYTFRVKAANSDGIWNETGTSLVLIITPPFWMTAWFLFLSVVLTIGLLILAYKWRVSAIQNQNRQLERTVEERTTLLQHANTELKKHINEKDKLLCIIGHDLRNPFFSIIGYMELLEEEFENTQNSEHLENIQYLLNVSRNTHNLLENLLQWSIKETKIFEVKAEVLDLGQIADTAIKMVSAQADFKKIKLEKYCREEVFTYGDRNMILTVLRNLISNAIKFSAENSRIEILVSTEAGDIVVSVRDYGKGMEKSVLSRLFSRSAEQQTGTWGEIGTGLGLVLCQEIIQKHAGKIWAESSPGDGSTFSFSLNRFVPAEVAV